MFLDHTNTLVVKDIKARAQASMSTCRRQQACPPSARGLCRFLSHMAAYLGRLAGRASVFNLGIPKAQQALSNYVYIGSLN